MSYDNKGRFGLWRNKDRKEQTHPHLSGQGETLDGQACWVSAWFSKDLSAGDKAILADMVQRYEGTSQKPFINVVTRMKQPSTDQARGDEPAGSGAIPNDEFDDDVPF